MHSRAATRGGGRRRGDVFCKYVNVYAVADVGSHLVRLLGLRRFAVMSTRVLGKSGVPGHLTGAIEASTFDEPLALAYAHGILHVGCYGGEAHGTVSAITPTGFAVRTLNALSKAYDAIGYVPSSATLEQLKEVVQQRAQQEQRGGAAEA